MAVRPADPSELDHLARLWHEGWHDGHGHIAPAGLVKARTLERFRARLAAALADVFVIGPRGARMGSSGLGATSSISSMWRVPRGALALRTR